jgi:uncharacterized repeat protein (TIGR01451 family)
MINTESGDFANGVERNVKITRSTRILAILLCALTLVGVLLKTRSAGAAPLDHFSWSIIASPQGAGAPFTATLMASDDAGNLVSNYFGNLNVSAEILSAPPLVISEVDNGYTNQVEFTNPSTNSIDVSGWKVAFYDPSKWPQPRTIFSIPAGTICPPESVFVIAAGGVAPGTFPVFFIGSPLAWSRFSYPIAVSLLNQTNGLVDFFCASTAYPYLITNPVPILPGGWFGGPVPLNVNLAYTYQRQGDFNQRQALDWIATNRSIGILNSNLSLPFTANYTPIGVSPGSVSLTNGVWSGLLTVDAPGNNVVLHADNEDGNPGVSNPFNVVNGTSVILSLPAQTSDTTPGIQPAAISIPSAIGMDLVFNLASSAPSKIGVPASVVVAAGTTSAGFNLTNFNDSILDGVQLVTVTASNYLFPPVQSIITNFSAPVPLELTLPNEANQQAGTVFGQAQISTSVSVGSNFQAELFSSDPSLLVTPSFVSIPAGQTNASFNFTIPSSPQILGSLEVTVTAFAGPGSTASGSITVSGQPTNLTLLLPGALIEGMGEVSNDTVAIAGILPTNLTVELTSSDPAALQVPANVVLPAGQTSVVVPLTVLTNSGPGPDLSVTISASAAGFVNANGSVTIQDNHLDHFEFAGIPLAQTANQAFAISILAENESGDTLQSYSGSASLLSIGLPGGSIVPTQTGNFTNGLWSGTVSITVTGTNVMVGAQNGSASGQSNPFDVGQVFVSTLNATIGGLIYDPGTDRIYGTIPASGGAESNTVMRLNPYTSSVEAYIPVDTNPGLMTLSASNEYIYLAVQGGYSVERLNLASQTPDLEFPLPSNPWETYVVANLMGLPNSPPSIAISGYSGGLVQDFIYDGNIARTNLDDLALVPGLDDGGILSDGFGYLPSGLVLAPTNQQPIGQFEVPGTVSSSPVAPDPTSGSVFFLSQQGSQTVISAYNMATFALQGSQTIPGVVGTAQNLVRWGTNGLAFSTTGGQIFLIQSSLCPGPSAAQLSVSQTGPALAAIGNTVTFTVVVTNSGSIGASDVILYDPLPAGTSFVSANSSQGTVQVNNGILTGSLGTIPPNGSTTVTLTVNAQEPGILTNTVNIATTTVDSDPVQETSIWVTTVINSASGNPIANWPLAVNDLVFNPTDGKLYASVSWTSSNFGNSIVAIDPLSLQVSNPIAIGSDPGALALAPDGRYLYVYLEGTASIELVDLQMDTVTLQYQLASSLALTEMFVLPGSSDSLLFSQYYTGGTPSDRGVEIITGGVTSAVPAGGDLIQPSIASNVFYWYGNSGVPSAVGRVQLNGTNVVSSTAAGGLTLDLEPEIRSAGDLLFFSSGEVIDPESMIHLASFPGLAAPPYLSQPLNQICPDLASGRVYYLISNGSTATIAAYSLNTYQLTGTFQINGILGTPEQLVRWGTNGFAFATTGGQVFSFQAPIVPTNQPADLEVTQSTPNSTTLLTNFTITITVTNQGPGVATGVVVYDVLPSGMRFVSASSTQGSVSTTGGALTALLGTLNAGNVAQVSILLRPDVIGSSANYVRVAANEPDPVMTNNSSVQPIAIATNICQNIPLYIGDLVYDPSRGKVFATVESAGAYSNSIIQIDPGTGNIERFLPTSFTPYKIAITSDGQFLYVGDTQAGNVARVNIQAWTNDLTFSLGNAGVNAGSIGYIVGDFAPLPGQPHSIAVSMNTWYGNYDPQVAIFDDGISRPNIIGEAGAGTYFIQASPDASTLYVVNPDSAVGYAINPSTFIPYAVNPSGIGAALTNLAGYSSDFRIEDNLLITDSGQVLNLQNDTAQGTYPVSGLVAPDLENGIVYFLVDTGSVGTPTWTLMAYSTNMVDIPWQITVTGATGTAYSLHRCGSNTLAFATAPSVDMNYGLIPTANQLFFVNTSELPAAGDLVLSVATNWAFAGGDLINTFTILNDGQYYNATGVSFTNVLPSGSIFVSATSTQGTCVQSNGIVTCAVGSMTGGSTVTITVVSIVPTAGSVPLQASVSKNEPQLYPSDNQISLTEMIYPPPSVTVSNLSVYRQSGVTATFNIVLASPSTQPISLYCYTTNGSAVSSRDYLAVSTTLTIPPGATNANLPVTIENNGLVESNVVFYLNVSVSPSAAPIATGSCTLINNNFYGFSVTNISLTSSPSGITNAVFSVSLSGNNYTSASVDYFTRDGTAASGRDYAGKAGTLAFPSGVTTEMLSIPVSATPGYGPTKTFYLILANPVNAVLGVSQAMASILNTDVMIGPSQLLSDGRFQLTMNGGVSGQSYVLLASTNLVDWTPISGFVDTNPPITIYDPDAVEYSQRFYRIGPLSLAPPMKLGVNAGKPFNAMLYALPGLGYEIDASTDLINWLPLTNFIGTNSPFYFNDPTATNYNQRFYRAVIK